MREFDSQIIYYSCGISCCSPGISLGQTRHLIYSKTIFLQIYIIFPYTIRIKNIFTHYHDFIEMWRTWIFLTELDIESIGLWCFRIQEPTLLSLLSYFFTCTFRLIQIKNSKYALHFIFLNYCKNLDEDLNSIPKII